MHETKSTIFDVERQISVIAVRVKQQKRIIGELPEGLGRLEALSVYAELLRNEYELERYRAQLRKQLSAYSLSGAAASHERIKAIARSARK
jgi:hypothetical protein